MGSEVTLPALVILYYYHLPSSPSAFLQPPEIPELLVNPSDAERVSPQRGMDGVEGSARDRVARILAELNDAREKVVDPVANALRTCVACERSAGRWNRQDLKKTDENRESARNTSHLEN